MNETPRAGLYVHVPFCKTKCPYCDFYSVTSLSLISSYLEGLQREIRLYTDLFPLFDTIYIGGGTPSLLMEEQLCALMDSLFTHLHFSHDREVTIEVNPDDISPRKLALFRELGINRVSLGIQSFDDRELHLIGRRHTTRQVEQATEWIRGSGFYNLGIDLIYGLPRQTTEAWLKTLRRALDFEPEHVSCYQMTLEGGTPFDEMHSEGMMQLPGEEQGRELFLGTSELLEDQGYIHYEISNFARGSENISCHNSKYWDHSPYLGLGPGAHSFLNGVRWWNSRSVTGYCRDLSEGMLHTGGREILTAGQLYLETLFLGLRTKRGVALEVLTSYPQRDKVLHLMRDAELAQVHGNRITPTQKGFLMADTLPLLFTE